MTSYRVIHWDQDKWVIEKEFSDLGDALKYLGKSPFIRPILVDSSADLDNLPFDEKEIMKVSIQRIGLPEEEKPS